MSAKKGVDPACVDLAAHFLGEAYKPWPPAKEEAERDLISLSKIIQETVDDWFFAKFDGEYE